MSEPKLSAADVQAIKARADAATPEPWVSGLQYNDGTAEVRYVYQGTATGAWTPLQVARMAQPADQEFVIHARTDVPALCDDLAAWRALVGELLAVIDAYRACPTGAHWTMIERTYAAAQAALGAAPAPGGAGE